jgi:hypothetical protein
MAVMSGQQGATAIRRAARRFSVLQTREYQIRLITPMFGGVEAGEPD